MIRDKLTGPIFLFFLCSFNYAGSQVAVPTVNLNTFKWGLKDSATNDVILAPSYDYIMEFHNGIAITRLNQHYGFINESGNEIAPPVYKRCFWVNDSLLLVQRDELFGVINAKGQTKIPCVFSSLEVYENYAVVSNGEKSGLIDLSGNIIIPFTYEAILTERNRWGGNYLHPHHLRIRTKTGMGIIDYSNKKIVPDQFDRVYIWPEHHLLIVDDEQHILLNRHGEIVIPPGKFQLSDPISEGRIVAQKNGFYGFIDLLQNTHIPFHYKKVHAFEGGLATAQKDSLWGLINQKNEVVLPFEYNQPIFFFNGIARIEKKINNKNKFAYLNSDLKQITSFEFDEGSQFENDYAQVRIGNKWGVLDKNGRKIVPVEYDKIAVRYGYVVVSTSEKYGLYDLEGKMILPNIYSFVYPTRDDPYIMVRMGRNYGFVNHQGKVVIPLHFENARNFNHGWATVLLDGESFEINREGKRIRE